MFSTGNYVNAARIASIKEGAIVINPSPMELFDFNTLVNRLKKGDIIFMLDHSDEMTKEQLDTLKPFDNCIIFPPMVGSHVVHEAEHIRLNVTSDILASWMRN